MQGIAIARALANDPKSRSWTSRSARWLALMFPVKSEGVIVRPALGVSRSVNVIRAAQG